jgi:hypothetical protein
MCQEKILGKSEEHVRDRRQALQTDVRGLTHAAGLEVAATASPGKKACVMQALWFFVRKRTDARKPHV